MDSFSSDFGFGSQSFSQLGGYSSSPGGVNRRRSSLGIPSSPSVYKGMGGSLDSVGEVSSGGRASVSGGVRGGVRRDGIEGCVPATVSMIYQSFLSKRRLEGGIGGHHDSLSLHGKAVGAVVLCGWVDEVEVLLSQVKFKLCDGTGKVEVFFDLSTSNSADEKENSWRSRKTDALKAGALIRVVGAAVASASGTNRNTNTDETTGDAEDEEEDVYGLCTIEACHFRPITDFREYAYFADVEVAFAAMQISGISTKEEEQDQTHTNEIKNDKENLNIRNDLVKKESNKEQDQDQWEDFSLPEVFDHITDECHTAVLKTLCLHANTNAGSGGDNFLTSQDIFTSLKHKFRVPELSKAVDALLDGGEIYQETGDRLALAI